MNHAPPPDKFICWGLTSGTAVHNCIWSRKEVTRLSEVIGVGPNPIGLLSFQEEDTKTLGREQEEEQNPSADQERDLRGNRLSGYLISDFQLPEL